LHVSGSNDKFRLADSINKDADIKQPIAAKPANDRAPLQRIAYSVAEAAIVSNLSRSKLYELIGSGELKSIKISGRRLIRHHDLLDLLQMGGARWEFT
jgi:excisionase family DNA binding protein